MNKNIESQNLVLDLLRRYKINPNKLRGQNFLIDDKIYTEIINTADLSKNDIVLEIGPGLGTLTERLSAKVKNVIAIEIDEKLAELTQKRLSYVENITVVKGNALDVSIEKLNIIKAYKVVANIPYYITSALLKKFLTDDRQPISLTLLVQREVGERIVADPGQMSLLSLSVQLYSKSRIVKIVSPHSFYPAPKVESVILQINNVHSFPFKDVAEKFFWQVARIGFSAKRKYLKNNLVAGLNCSVDKVVKIFKSVGVNDKARAQELSVDDWRNLTTHLKTL